MMILLFLLSFTQKRKMKLSSGDLHWVSDLLEKIIMEPIGSKTYV